MPAGRPTKYDPKYCQKIIDFFADHVLSKERIRSYTKSGEPIIEEVATEYPTISDFAKKIKVNRSSISEWAKNYPEFSNALKIAKQLQHEIIIKSALMGLYNASFAIFTMKNIAGWRDKQPDQEDDDLKESDLSFSWMKSATNGNKSRIEKYIQ